MSATKMNLNGMQLAAACRASGFQGDPRVVPTALAFDSRQVRPGTLFACLHGARFDGHEYAAEAVANGAVMLLCEKYLEHLSSVPQIVVTDSREALGSLAAAFYGHPARRLRVIGVTGTNGKTTTTFLIQSMLQAAGHKTGLMGTIVNRVGDEDIESIHTTPEAPDIQAMLARMAQAGCDAAVMEVSSHGLDQKRLVGTEFSVGLFTNLSRDHLDYHGTWDAYRDAKLSLFASLTDRAIINGDDGEAVHFARTASAPVLTYGLHAANLDITATDVSTDTNGIRFIAHTPAESFAVELALSGTFNVYNALGAIAVGYGWGLSGEQMARSLALVQVPGRFERIAGRQPFAVIVDYAHTPDGLHNVLRTADDLAPGRVTVVFGAGGDRDPGKRALMGGVAGRIARRVIITADNPRSENVSDISAAIAAGIETPRDGLQIDIIHDRRAAIRAAMDGAAPGDVVLIAGKGHETYQESKGQRVHFDDREEARRAVKERYGSA